MKLLIAIPLWVLLFLVCWPLALLAIVMLPVIWLIALPFRMAGAAVRGVLALFQALVMLPARLLGYRA